MYPAPRLTSTPPAHDRATKSTHPFSGALLREGVAVLVAAALPVRETDALREKVREALDVIVALLDLEAMRVGLRVVDGDREAVAATVRVRDGLASTDRVRVRDAVTDRVREPDAVTDGRRELDRVSERVRERETVADGRNELDAATDRVLERDLVVLRLTLREIDGDAARDLDRDALRDTLRLRDALRDTLRLRDVLCDCARGGVASSSSNTTSKRSNAI